MITGALGYLGGRTTRYLSETGDYALVLACRRPRADCPGWALAHDVVWLDLERGGLSPKCLEGIDTVVHLAALNAGQSAANPVLSVQVNIGGTQALVSAAERAGVRRFIYASTAHVYGAPLSGVIDEDKTVPRPRHPYAWSHRAAEDVVLGAKNVTGIVLRLSNGVGAPIDSNANCWTLVANDLCWQAATFNKLVLRHGGVERRDFIAISDIERAFAHFIECPPLSIDSPIFNVGSGISFTTSQLARRIADRAAAVLGRRPSIHPATSAVQERGTSLDFRISKLLASGFQLRNDLNGEIDETLRFCSAARAEKMRS